MRQGSAVTGHTATREVQILMLAVMFGVLVLDECLFDHGLVLRHVAALSAMDVFTLRVVHVLHAGMCGVDWRAVTVMVGQATVLVVDSVSAVGMVMNDPAIGMVFDMHDMMSMRMHMRLHTTTVCRMHRGTIVVVMGHVPIGVVNGHAAVGMVMDRGAILAPLTVNDLVAMRMMFDMTAARVVTGSLFAHLRGFGPHL